MRIESAPSYPVTIFIGGNMTQAEHICRDYCDEIGLCVTVDFARYIYTGGGEDGVVIGLINYPRFPKSPEEIWALAEALSERLLDGLGQQSYTIQAPDKTVWFSHRPEDLAA